MTPELRAARAVRRWRLQGWRTFIPQLIYQRLESWIASEIREAEHMKADACAAVIEKWKHKGDRWTAVEEMTARQIIRDCSREIREIE